MRYLLAIDPGAKTGVAMFFRPPPASWTLDKVYTVAVPGWGESVQPQSDMLVVIENPVIYPNGKARPKDVLTLARIVGRYQERFARYEQRLVEPREWKGSVDGDIMTQRIKDALTPHERITVGAADHNALDAVGLGKWSLRQPWMRGR